MISYGEVRLAEWVLKKACRERIHCYECPHYYNCDMVRDEGFPDDWDVSDKPSEPTERQRIEWLRMLPDDEMMIAIEPFLKCADCQWHGVDCCNNDDMTCNNGHMKWWHEVVSLEQFRKEVGIR